MEIKKAIVTGANGFVGGALTRELIANNVHVIALDMDGHSDNLPESPLITFIPMDLSDVMSLVSKIPQKTYDVFYHFAWAGSAGNARVDVDLQLNNAKWTVDCLKLCKEIGCSRFVCAGSIMENEIITATFTPESRPSLAYIYGSGKLVAHMICKSVAADLGIDLLWAQITNAYGVGELSPRFINTTLRKVIANEPLLFTSGTQNYDFVYIDDVSRAFYLIGGNGKPFCEYIIGSSGAKPLKDFILDMKSAVAPNHSFIFGDVPYTGINLPLELFDCSQTEHDTGFKAQVSFSEGIKKTFNWLKTMEE